MVLSPTKPTIRAPRRILLVEDDDALRQVLAELLRADGAEVVQARDGVEAEGFVAREGRGYDVVITDIEMPRRSGMELARALRARGSGVPVIFISAFAESIAPSPASLVERALLVAKPFEPDDLRTAVLNIERLVDRR